jgi:hypothetical protein
MTVVLTIIGGTIRQYQGLWCTISPRSLIEGGRCLCQAMRKSSNVPGVYAREPGSRQPNFKPCCPISSRLLCPICRTAPSMANLVQAVVTVHMAIVPCRRWRTNGSSC